MTGNWFISHNSLDKQTARAVSVLLAAQGLRPWLDEWEIRAGDQIVHAVGVGLQQAEGIIVLWSAHASASHWVNQELGVAVQRAITSRGAFRVVPVVLDDTALPPLLVGTAFVDWRGDKPPVEKLLRAVGVAGADRKSVLLGLTRLMNDLGAQAQGVYGLIACERCGSENLEDGHGYDSRDDHYAWTTCKDCGHSVSGEVP